MTQPNQARTKARREADRRYRLRPEVKLRKKLWDEQHRAEKKLYNKSYREQHRDAERRRGWKRAGVNAHVADKLLRQHDGKCALCATSSPGGRGWQIDHDHTTGRVRGVLCLICNTRLGWFEQVGITAIIAYLKAEA